MRCCLSHLLSFVLMLGAPSPSVAQPSAVQRAREQVAKARVHFKLQEFDAAAAAWREAYRLHPTPALLFNIGQAERMAGRPREAKHAYESYLADLPNAPNRAEVEQRIAELSQKLAAGAPEESPQLEAQHKAPAAPPTDVSVPAGPPVAVPAVVGISPTTHATTPAVTSALPNQAAGTEAAAAPSPSAFTRARIARLVLATVAGALVVTSGVEYLRSRSAFAEVAEQERPRAEQDALLSSAERVRLTSIGLAAGAGAALAGATLTFAF